MLTLVRGACRISAVLAVVSTLASGCGEINTDPHTVAAIALDSVPAPSVVAGDSLRDSLGVARPLRATVFNPQGAALTGVVVRYRAADPGLTVDSLTGYVVADTARSTPVRVVADAGGLQTAPVPLYAVPAPDSVAAVAPPDTFSYSLSDSTRRASPALSVRVLHTLGVSTPVPVQAYRVSYAVIYPTDTAVAQIVGDDGRTRTRVDTTGSDGTAGRRVRIVPVRLVSPNDSVVVLATVRYRGRPVGGSPVRFFLRLTPTR